MSWSTAPQEATRVAARLRTLAALLQERPLSGQKMREGTLRRVVATPYPYIVYYELTETDVLIVGVRHGARDPRTAPGEG